VNERIEQIDKAAEGNVDHEETLFEFLCECGKGDADDVACKEHVEMTIWEYDAVRSQDDRFALRPGHEEEALESVADRNERLSSSTKSRAQSGSSQTIHAVRRLSDPPVLS
jgi:hypothetical protein